MNLADLNTTKACNNAVEFELEHPVAGPTGEFISIVGVDSDIAVNKMRELANESRAKASKQAKLGKEIKLNTVEQDEADTVEQLVACTTAFRSNPCSTDEGGAFLHYNGQLTFTPENARKLYTDELWIRRFISKKRDDIANFMKG